MREQLIQYVELLFAGAEDSDDIRQEILQNTLDRYDDLIAQGRVPEAAYRLAITGIGDINEILGTSHRPAAAARESVSAEDGDTPKKKLMRAIAVGLYIISFLPLFLLSELGMSTLGLCGTLMIAAVATVLLLLGAKKSPPEEETSYTGTSSPQQELKRSIGSLIWTGGLVMYFLISLLTQAWYITWLMFPLIGAVRGLVNAIIDLKEAQKYEN